MNDTTPLIDAYIEWLQGLSAQSAHRVSRLVNSEVRMATPAEEGVGPDAVKAMHAALFDDAASVTIRVLARAADPERNTVFLRWDRLVTSRTGARQTLSGVTELMVGIDGKIASVTEYWDRMPEALPQRGFFAKLFGT